MKYRILPLMLLILLNPAMAATTAEYLNDADAYVENRDYKAAIIQLKNALQQEPTNAEARLRLGEVYLLVGNGPAAEKEYRKAKVNGALISQWMPKLAEAMLIQGRGTDVLYDITVTDEMSEKVKADILGKRGQAYLMTRDIDAAAASFDEALTLDKNNAFALLGSARILASKNELEDAKKQVDLALNNKPDDIIALTLRAELARQTGEFLYAKTSYNKALKIYPSHMPALIGLAGTHLVLNEFSEADKLADKIIKVNEDIPVAHYIKALMSFKNKNEKEAEVHLSRVLNLSPGHLPSSLLMGRLQYSKGSYEQAEKHLRDFYHKNSTHLPAIKLLAATRLKLKNIDGAEKILLKAEAHHENDADILSMLGLIYSQSGDASKGSEYFERAAKISPDRANVQTQLGLSYLVSGELEHAVSTLENALKLDEDFERADVMLILAHLRKKDYENALMAAKAFAKKQPENPMAYNFQGAAYSGKGDDKKSRLAFEKALKINPDFSVAELNLARLDIKEDNPASAKKRFKSVIKNENENINAYLGLAKLLLQQGEKEESLKWVKLINQKRPEAIQPAIVLNRFYLIDKQPAKALDIAQSLALAHPTLISAQEMLASTQIENGKLPEAINTYESMVELTSNDANIRYKLALLQLRNKNHKGAKQTLDQVLKLNDQHIGALSTYASLDIKAKKYKTALIKVEKLKASHPKNAVGWVIEGDVYNRQKKHALAIEYYQTAFEKEKSNRIVFKLAKAYEQANERDQSILTLINWLNDNKKDLAGYIMLAQFYQNRNEDSNAAKVYEKVLIHNPNNLVALNNIAWIYSEQGNKKGLEYAKKAYDLAPNNPSVGDTYGWSLILSGKVDKGVNIIKAASITAPHILEIKYHLAYGYHKQNKNKLAKAELKRLLENENFQLKEKAKALLEKLN